MTAAELLDALQVAANAMRRCDPSWCAAHEIEQITDVEWDDALATVEDAIDAYREKPGIWLAGLTDDEIARVGASHEAT
jgi:hypothetical protein